MRWGVGWACLRGICAAAPKRLRHHLPPDWPGNGGYEGSSFPGACWNKERPAGRSLFMSLT